MSDTDEEVVFGTISASIDHPAEGKALQQALDVLEEAGFELQIVDDETTVLVDPEPHISATIDPDEHLTLEQFATQR